MRAPTLDDVRLELARRAAAAAAAADAGRHKSLQALRADAELLEWVDKTFGVRIPNKRVCPTHRSPAEAFCDAYFARSPVMIWKGSRGFGGKSFTLGLLGVTLGCTLKADVTVLGGSGQQSARILEGMTKLWAAPEAPRHLLAGDPGTKTTRFRDGQQIIALMASQNSVRGPHPQALLLDEIDEMDLDILEAAQGQPMDRGTVRARTVMSSTHQNPDGTMTAMLRRAAEKGWPVYEWCWRETLEPHGWLTRDQVDRKRQEISAQMWDTEYDLQEPSTEGRAIDTEAVGRMFQRALGEFKGGDREAIVLETRVPVGRYAHGADWAKKKDWTVVVTLRTDVQPYRLVAFQRVQRRPWPQMVGILDERVKLYGDATSKAWHDGTGVGDVVAGYLKSDAKPFMMVGRARADLLSEYIGAVEHDEIAAPFIESMEAEHKYATVDDVYGAGHLPDTIAATALAYRAAKKGVVMPDGVMDVGAGASTGVGLEREL
jgi:hypothetical protein